MEQKRHDGTNPFAIPEREKAEQAMLKGPDASDLITKLDKDLKVQEKQRVKEYNKRCGCW